MGEEEKWHGYTRALNGQAVVGASIFEVIGEQGTYTMCVSAENCPRGRVSVDDTTTRLSFSVFQDHGK